MSAYRSESLFQRRDLPFHDRYVSAGTDIAPWLEDLGLSRYLQVFEDNDIDMEVLGELTESDLEKIGVSLGHRKKMLKAIASGVEEAGRQAPDAGNLPPSHKAEYKYITVMFCDLVGSTALTHRLGAERMREINRSYQDYCRDTINRFDGFVARYMGDGVLAYFGYPVALEDAAERALRAGLEILDKLNALNAAVRGNDSFQLAVRVGAASGRVVIDEVDAGRWHERNAVGDAPNLAARLQGLADPGSMVIGADTRRLVGDVFRYESAGVHHLKGVDTPVEVWKVLGASSVESRFAAIRGTPMGRFVGRGEELDLLLSRWQRALGGEGQVVYLSGEAGIGKSRLLEVALERTAGERCRLFRLYCSPYHRGNALYPILERLNRQAGLSAAASAADKQRRVESVLLNEYRLPRDAVAVFAALTSLDLEEIFPPPELSPQQQLALFRDAIAGYLIAQSDAGPVLIVMEDLHWIDPTSLTLVQELVDSISDKHVFLLLSSRPESAPEIAAPHVTRLSLNRLGKSQVSKLIRDIGGDAAIPDAIVEKIGHKCDGVPLFVEEITKMILEVDDGALGERELAVPDSLQASLLARLDRLGDAREIAQTASVIGGTVSPEIVAAVTNFEREVVQEAFDSLVEHKVMGSGQRRRVALRVPPRAAQGRGLRESAAKGSCASAQRDCRPAGQRGSGLGAQPALPDCLPLCRSRRVGVGLPVLAESGAGGPGLGRNSRGGRSSRQRTVPCGGRQRAGTAYSLTRGALRSAHGQGHCAERGVRRVIGGCPRLLQAGPDHRRATRRHRSAGGHAGLPDGNHLQRRPAHRFPGSCAVHGGHRARA